ncbi:MAG: RagB/SusD family nutrient uptake outer membrane protein [Saprospiraceae bacterium]|nr:RagB/SusD family nutrient uptake outer membrane protein [Saprospiraceae bacterium]
MKKSIVYILLLFTCFFSCTDELNQEPTDGRETDETAFQEDPLAAYQEIIAKVYASFILTGQQGPAGNADVSFPDEGFTSYIRQYFKLQEWSTDEGICAWTDPGIPQINENTWGTTNSLVSMIYSRIFFTVSIANDFLRQATPEKLDARGLTASERELVERYSAEARFLRAMAYYHALDLFGNVAPVFETDPEGFFTPERMTRSELFDYVESELLAIEGELLAPRASYGRADQGALWMLLAKLYLNAEVYTGTPRYTESLAQLNKVIQDGGYALADDYSYNFLADNHTSPEIIYPIVSDGELMQNFGGTTFIIAASLGDPISGATAESDFGTNQRWFGHRTRSSLIDKFDDFTGAGDERAIFGFDGFTKDIETPRNYGEGFAVLKYKNRDKMGNPGSNIVFSDVDFPVFRLADAYLMYAECVVRGGAGGDMATATQYINDLRDRAFGVGNPDGNVGQSEIDLDFLIDERARELYWEAHRRQDLIRFGNYTGSTYNWPWKGGSASGTSIPDFRAIYPIPSADLSANPNLIQNPGY